MAEPQVDGRGTGTAEKHCPRSSIDQEVSGSTLVKVLSGARGFSLSVGAKNEISAQRGMPGSDISKQWRTTTPAGACPQVPAGSRLPPSSWNNGGSQRRCALEETVLSTFCCVEKQTLLRAIWHHSSMPHRSSAGNKQPANGCWIGLASLMAHLLSSQGGLVIR